MTKLLLKAFYALEFVFLYTLLMFLALIAAYDLGLRAAWKSAQKRDTGRGGLT